MSKHQWVEDGKVYEADKDTGAVKEVGTVTPSGSSFWDLPGNIVNSVSDTIQEGIDAVIGGDEKK